MFISEALKVLEENKNCNVLIKACLYFEKKRKYLSKHAKCDDIVQYMELAEALINCYGLIINLAEMDDVLEMFIKEDEDES